MESLEIWHYAILFLAAFLGGFIDAIAGGGGLICLPVLLGVGLPPHIALATNKLQGTFGSFTAALNFSLKGLVDFTQIWIGIVFTFIGAMVGTILILFINPQILNYIIPFLLGFIFIYTIFSPKIGDFDVKARINERLFYIIFGLLLGFYDGFFGPGTGSFWTFCLVLMLGINMKKAVAHTKVLNFTSNIVSLVVFIIGGQILWLVGILMGFGQVLGAYFGSKLVIKKEIKFIRTIFLVVVAFTILNLLYKLFS